MKEIIVIAIWSVICYYIGLFIGYRYNKKGGSNG